MSRKLDCGRCGVSHKEVAIPSDVFGYFVSCQDVESIENDLGIGGFALHDWLDGERRTEGVSDRGPATVAAHCFTCGSVYGKADWSALLPETRGRLRDAYTSLQAETRERLGGAYARLRERANKLEYRAYFLLDEVAYRTRRLARRVLGGIS